MKGSSNKATHPKVTGPRRIVNDGQWKAQNSRSSEMEAAMICTTSRNSENMYRMMR